MTALYKQHRTTVMSALLVAVIALSGCTGGGDSQAEENANDQNLNSPDAKPTEETGVIRGQVFDEVGLPIVGAQVALQSDLNSLVVTDDQGAFGLGGLDPDDYVVIAHAIGYSSQSRTATVAAGQTTEIEFSLKSTAVQGVPYSRSIAVEEGKFFCGFSALVIAGPCKGISFTDPNNPVEQAWGTVAGDENNILVWETVLDEMKANEDDELANIVIEVVWSPVTASANKLQASIEQNPANGQGRNITDTYIWTSTSGTNPLKMTATPGEQGPGGNRAMPDNVSGFTVGVFPDADDSAGTPVPLPTFYTEQRFEVWVTLFYNEPAPDDFTHLG